jgi:hypothetical protein
MALSNEQFRKRIEKAKQGADIRDVIESTGAQPVRSNTEKGEYQYHAPYREDRTPSLTINVHDQTFCDYGMTGANGDVIQLTRLILGKGDVNSMPFFEAVKWLERRAGGSTVAPKAFVHPQRQKKPSRDPSQTGRFAFVKATPVSSKTHPNNLDYITETRKISLRVASRHLFVIAYKDSEAAFDDPLRGMRYGIGGPNDSGGYEVRAPSQNSNFKMVLGPKDVTTIHGRPDNDIGHVFEGRFDFLTYLEMSGLDQPVKPTIILNSGSMAPRAAEVIKNSPELQHVKNWYIWQQNDDEGDRSTQAFISELNSGVADYSVYTLNPWYDGYKDLNKFWTDAPAEKARTLQTSLKGNVQPVQKSYDTSASAEIRRTNDAQRNDNQLKMF